MSESSHDWPQWKHYVIVSLSQTTVVKELADESLSHVNEAQTSKEHWKPFKSDLLNLLETKIARPSFYIHSSYTSAAAVTELISASESETWLYSQRQVQ